MEHFLTGKRKNDSVLYITGETLAINHPRRPGNEISDNNNKVLKRKVQKEYCDYTAHVLHYI